MNTKDAYMQRFNMFTPETKRQHIIVALWWLLRIKADKQAHTLPDLGDTDALLSDSNN